MSPILEPAAKANCILPKKERNDKARESNRYTLRKERCDCRPSLETGPVGAMVIDPNPHEDDRERFMRAWCVGEFTEHGLNFLPVQANLGFSVQKGTARGMHFQEATALEAKLVRCTKGAIFDVVLDLRPESSTYAKWYARS